MHIHKIWRRLTTTRYVRTLEADLALERAVIARLDAVIAEQAIEIAKQDAEIARLRAENRALLNSILGIAGVPPVAASLDDLAETQNQIAAMPPGPPQIIRAHARIKPTRRRANAPPFLAPNPPPARIRIRAKRKASRRSATASPSLTFANPCLALGIALQWHRHSCLCVVVTRILPTLASAPHRTRCTQEQVCTVGRQACPTETRQPRT